MQLALWRHRRHSVEGVDPCRLRVQSPGRRTVVSVSHRGVPRYRSGEQGEVSDCTLLQRVAVRLFVASVPPPPAEGLHRRVSPLPYPVRALLGSRREGEQLLLILGRQGDQLLR